MSSRSKSQKYLGWLELEELEESMRALVKGTGFLLGFHENILKMILVILWID